jgi:hypothetical protein
MAMLTLPRRDVEAPAAAIRFCRYATALALWAAYVLRSKELAAAIGLLLLLNAVLGIRRAPLVQLYWQTAQRLWPSPMVAVDECGLRFAHGLGTLAAAAGAALAYVPQYAAAGWTVLLALAALKTLGAVFMCPVSGLYTCLASGGACCAWLRRKRAE